MANLAILKLYQFNPHLVNDVVITNILVKALTAIPNPDFNLCLYLLQEGSLSEDNVSKLVLLQQLLEEARYQEFWEVYEKDDIYKDLTIEAVGFDTAIRKVILTAVCMAYQTISVDLLRTYLNYKKDDNKFEPFVQSQGLTIKDDVVIINTNYDNEAKPTVIRENIKFEQLTKVIGYSNEL